MKPPAGKPPRSSPEEARLAIERLLAAGKELVVIEDGDQPIAISEDNYFLGYRSGYLTFDVWNEERNLSRRITGIATETRVSPTNQYKSSKTKFEISEMASSPTIATVRAFVAS